jgi:3D (Asp-Asp-Asp) domain-containing protein
MKRILFIVILFSLFSLSKAQSITTHVTLTCYQPVKEQCNDKPLITSDGSKINLKHLKAEKIKWCAISRDLLYLFPKGKPKKIYIEGYGIYEVRDVMNKRHTHRVDILIHPKDSKRISIKNVKIKIIS